MLRTLLLLILASPVLAAEPLVVGTLQSDIGRTSKLKAAGVSLVTVDVKWDRFQPRDQQADLAYAESVKKAIAAFREAGMRVQLDLGMQYPPAWVQNQPNARFVNQYGKPYVDDRPGANVVNAVFNQSMRNLQTAYLAAVFVALGDDFYAVRLGWNYYGELGFPAASFKDQGNCYWAFDANAQGESPDLPPTIKACPLPGWKPGQPSHEHQAARIFANWYLEALADYQRFQIASVRKHYQGRLVILYGSWGIRPQMLETEITSDLGGRSQTEVSLGYDFDRLVNAITDKNVAVCTTWIDANPKFGDDSPVAALAKLAQAKKLELWSENTGKANPADMKLTIERARKHGVSTLVWAFEPDLFDGKHASLEDLKSLLGPR